MKTKFILSGLMAAVVLGTCAFTGYTVISQNKKIDFLATAINTYSPIIENKVQLNTMFNAYIEAASLKIKPSSSRSGLTDTSESADNTPSYNPSPDDERIYGNPEAPYLLIEFTDFECPYCKAHFPEILRLADVSRNNVAVIFKHVPGHGKASVDDAVIAECAGAQGGNPGFFKMASLIFENTAGNGQGLRKSAESLAEEAGIDSKKLISCINNPQSQINKISSDAREAIGLNINQTPSTIVVIPEKNRSALIQGTANMQDLIKVMGDLASASEKSTGENP